MVRRVGWVTMLLLAIVLALTSARYFLPDMPGAFEQQLAVYTEYRTWLMLHIGGAIVAILAGPWQFWSAFRARHLKWHRRIGKTYLAGVAVGSVSGLYLAFYAYGGFVTHAGFALLAILWGGTALTAFGRIRRREVEAHREWMVRSYSLALAGVTLRFWIPVLLALGVPFDEVYQTVAWLAWVPNLLVAELYLGWRRQQRAVAVA